MFSVICELIQQVRCKNQLVHESDITIVSRSRAGVEFFCLKQQTKCWMDPKHYSMFLLQSLFILKSCPTHKRLSQTAVFSGSSQIRRPFSVNECRMNERAHPALPAACRHVDQTVTRDCYGTGDRCDVTKNPPKYRLHAFKRGNNSNRKENVK